MTLVGITNGTSTCTPVTPAGIAKADDAPKGAITGVDPSASTMFASK
jgi:hypothetical protein